MKASVLCTAYNHEKYVAAALESFVSQKTDFPFEILVTDDASKDETPAIIAGYASRYPELIRYFHQEENLFSQGINIFPYLLFKEARGEYYAWCEGDDYWIDETKLQQQIDFLDSHPDYSGCVHNSYYEFCGSDRPNELLVPADCDRDIGFETIIQGLHKSFHTSSIVVRASVIKDPPDFYHTAFSHGFTDYAIALQMALCGKIRFIDKPMSVYRRTSNDESWSSGYCRDYDKLTGFVAGEIDMMQVLLPHLDGEQKALTEEEILKREYELLYLRGKVDEMVKPPYDRFYKQEPFRFRFNTTLKRLFPSLHRLYRARQGYKE